MRITEYSTRRLLALCDTYMWHLSRRQRGLSREQTERALVGMVSGLLRD